MQEAPPAWRRAPQPLRAKHLQFAHGLSVTRCVKVQETYAVRPLVSYRINSPAIQLGVLSSAALRLTNDSGTRFRVERYLPCPFSASVPRANFESLDAIFVSQRLTHPLDLESPRSLHQAISESLKRLVCPPRASIGIASQRSANTNAPAQHFTPIQLINGIVRQWQSAVQA